ncbi:MAG TPA: aldo/keto reductase [Terracidiphilus sp.]|nr:aldo/keto reductase [Terracidiphilus sp.]
MQKSRLGSSPLAVSKLSFGTWLTVAGGIERPQAIRCIHAALDCGINLFDTANHYGAGEAERVLGEALKRKPRESFLIATKLYFPVGNEPDHGLSAKQVEKQVECSLRRLKMETIDLYQCHRYDPDTPLEETLVALDKVIRDGKVRSFGISEWSAKQIHEATDLAGAMHLTGLASVQSQYSLLWRKPETAVFRACSENALGFLAYSPLAHGVLSGKYEPGRLPPTESRAASSEMNKYMETSGRHYRSDNVLQAVTGLKPIANDLGLTMAQLALAWILNQGAVTSAIIGASRPEQIIENTRAAGISLPVDLMAQIGSVVEPAAVY